MLIHSAESAANPDAAWALIAEPARWSEWAPHLRGAWGLGEPEVTDSALGAARLGGVIPVPARISRVEKSWERRHWVWTVAPGVHLDHEVRRRPGGGCVVSISCRAPWALERVIAASYWPLVGIFVRRLARVAESA